MVRSTWRDGVMDPEEQPSDVGLCTLQYLADRCEYDKYTGCWNWKLATDCYGGYGKLRVPTADGSRGKSYMVHRLAYRLYHGEWPEIACHTCNNRRCCNPTHIYSGSAVDNAVDTAQAKKEKQERALLAELKAKYE